MEDLVSIITPTYNCAKFIARTIETVQSQSYEHWEMIIVDDCSTDDTRDVVVQYEHSDSRIKYYCLSENAGPAKARNKAMELAQGSYMAFLDSDDIWKCNKLKKQLSFMKINHIPFSCTYYEQIDEEDHKLGKVFKAPNKTDYNRLLLDCPVGNSTVMYHVEKMGKYVVPDIRKRNDDALWLKMLKDEKYIFALPEVLTEYRVRSNSVSSNKISLIKYHWQLYRKIEHLSLLRSMFHIGYWCFIKVFRIK